MPIAVGTSSLDSLVTPEGLENAAKEVDRQLTADRQYPELAEQINASQGMCSPALFFLLLENILDAKLGPLWN